MDNRTQPRLSCGGSGPQLLPSCTQCYGEVLNNVLLLSKRSGGDRTMAHAGCRRAGRAVKVELWWVCCPQRVCSCGPCGHRELPTLSQNQLELSLPYSPVIREAFWGGIFGSSEGTLLLFVLFLSDSGSNRRTRKEEIQCQEWYRKLINTLTLQPSQTPSLFLAVS